MSISKSYNKKTGYTYVYEVTENYWDKEKKKQVQKRKLIGKIDPQTGEMVPTRKHNARAAAPEEPKPVPAESASSETKEELTKEASFLEASISALEKQIQELSSLNLQAKQRLTSIQKALKH